MNKQFVKYKIEFNVFYRCLCSNQLIKKVVYSLKCIKIENQQNLYRVQQKFDSKEKITIMKNQNPIYLDNVFTFKNLPVQQKQRKWTDCCCTIFTALFALSLFILSFFMFTKYNYYQVNFPADDLGITCYNDLRDYPFMYFANPSDPTEGRYCLKECPRRGQTIQCLNSQNITTNCRLRQSTYDTKPEINKIGAFCSPTDESLRLSLFSKAELGTKLSLTYGYSIIRLSFLIGFLVGLLYLAFVGCLSKQMTSVVFGLAFLVLLAAGLYALLRPVHLFKELYWTAVLCAILIVVGVAYLIYMVCYKNEIQLASIFVNHSNNFLRESYFVYLYIPLFLLLTIGFLVLIIWQFIAFGTAYRPTFQRQNIYYQSSHNLVLQILNVIELIWGLQFLRDAFNFVVSGNAVQWYFKSITEQRHICKPFSRLLFNHWGSVAGGSFLNSFFKIFDIFADCFNCDSRGSYGKCQSIYEKLCCCNYIFELIRTDTYAYINLTGIPYCNAARQCEALCKYSSIIKNSHSCIRVYRNAAHIFVVGLGALISYAIFDSYSNQYGNYDHFWVAAAIVFACYSMATYFVDIHENGAQAIMIAYLTEENCEGEQYVQVCPGQLRRDIHNYKSKYLEGYQNAA